MPEIITSKSTSCVVCHKCLKGKQKRFCSTICKGKYTNNTLQSYQAQKSRGNYRKGLLIQHKGGKCEICGYSKNTAALCFHHKDPSKKEFKMDLRDLSNRTWVKILKESEGCMLLCCNCHAELHHPNEWAPSGSNREPLDYESRTLTH